MKECTGYYQYKEFLINFSDYMQTWSLEPNYLNLDDNDILNFVIEYNNSYSPRFKTINKAKKYIKENEKELKTEIEKLLKNYLK